MFLHILQRVNSRREDEEHGRSRARLFKGDGEVQGSDDHVLATQFLLYKVSVGRKHGGFSLSLIEEEEKLL